jgi:hypothetical protein
MKKTTKVLFTALLAVGFGSLVHAQSATISANATVLSQITVVNNANLNFGTVIMGQTKMIDASDNVYVSEGSTAIGSANRGSFYVTAQTGSNVRLTFTLPTNLSKVGGGSLPISFPHYEETMGIVEDAYGTQDDFDLTIAYVINGFNSSWDWETSTSSFYIGGKVDATTATAGIYTGTITLSATYN